MTQKISTISQSPYYDDFDPAKDYVRVLFRPSYPVQARELTTLQSFIQEQASRFGDYVFKDGARITSGEITADFLSYRTTLTGSGNITFPPANALAGASLATVATLVGKVITNATGTVKAEVVQQPTGTVGTAQVGNMYLHYMTAEEFDSDGGFIYALASDNPTETQNYYNTYSAVTPSTLANIVAGVYYVKGVFTRVAEQTILIDANSQTPSAHIGFNVSEKIVTPSEDSTLFDNARGTSNEGAPGAHRLQIYLTFATKSIGSAPDASFYRVTTVENGEQQENQKVDELQNLVSKSDLAQSIFDESGHFALNPFPHVVEENVDDQYFTLNIGPSKAYVQGHPIVKTNTTKIDFTKGMETTNAVKNYKAPFVGTTYVVLDSSVGVLQGQNTTDPYNHTYRLQLKDSSNNVIGIARAYALTSKVSNKGIVEDRLYLYDIRMFTVLTFAGAGFGATLLSGFDVQSGKTKAYSYTDDAAAGIANGLTVINANGIFKGNQIVTSSVTNTADTISSVTRFDTSQITKVTSIDGSTYVGAVRTKSFGNSNSELVYTLDHHVSSLKNSGVIINNDFQVIGNTGTTANNLPVQNGNWDSAVHNDQNEITKTIKFQYLKIKNTRTSAQNFGWSALDKEISLHYPDISEVYKVNQATAATFASGRFPILTIECLGVIPMGSVILGSTSGTKAIVALSNSTAATTGALSSDASYHQFEGGTNSSSSLEVIFQKGVEFTADETLTVTVPGGQTAFTYSVKYISVTAATGVDVTSLFQLDDGQRSEYYDIGRLTRKPNTPAPSDDIVVFFSYYEADPTANHFYSADSYSEQGFFETDPRFYGETKDIRQKNDDSGRDLRNSIDFRLRVQPSTAIGSSPFNFASRVFYNQSRILPDTYFTSHFNEYFGRIDMISLSKESNFVIKKGVSAFNPTGLEGEEGAMLLSKITIPPAVRYPDAEVSVDVKDNRRYTMRDIGGLATRIDRLEESVALSLLESQALHDDVSGRTKSGFLVDDFSVASERSGSPADFQHEEFSASVDIIEKELISAQTSGVPIPMEVSSKSNTSDFFSGYIMNAFTEEKMVEQTNATSTHRINPFAVWIYKGDLKLSPNKDNWHLRKDNYFINLYGKLEPVSATEFANFAQVTPSHPGGRATSINEWVGREKKSATSSSSARTSGNTRVTTTTTNTTVRQARKTITTTKFDDPRAIGSAATSMSGSVVLSNPQEYKMRSMTVAFVADGLRPNTGHTGFFGGYEVLAGLTSNSKGEISGTFTIPANKVSAGTESFELFDTSTLGDYSSAEGLFSSIGHLDSFSTIQSGVTSVLNSSVEEDVIKSTGQNVRSVSTRISSGRSRNGGGGRSNAPTQRASPRGTLRSSSGAAVRSGSGGSIRTSGGDPIAQTFMVPIDRLSVVPTPEVSILTSVDVWFGNVDTRDAMNKVIIEIREVVNGYPGDESKIIGTSGYVIITAANEVTLPTNANSTNFKFREPVQLAYGREYSIVVKTPSAITTVFVASIGETLVDGSGIHDSQPNVGGHFGSFFVSQNASTWSAKQNTDLAFRVNRARFDTDLDGVLVLKNTISSLAPFNADVGAYNGGLVFETFANSNYVKVYHPNHGLNFTGAQVTLSGLGSNALNGIPVAELTASHSVYFPTLNTYWVKTTTAAASSGKPPVPVFTAFATQAIVYDSIVANLQVMQTERDLVSVAVRPTITAPVSLASDGSNKLVNTSIITPVADAYYEITSGEVSEFSDPMIVRNALNSTANDMLLQMTLQSGSIYSSPYFKMDNNINPIVFRNVTGNMLTDSEIDTTFLVSTVAAVHTDDEDQQYVSRLAAIQSELEHSAYVTKQIDLEIPADGFTIIFDADMNPTNKVEVAFKIRPIGDNTPFEDLEWVDFTSSMQVTPENFGPFSSDVDFKSFKLSNTTAFEFTSFKVRLRLRTENEAFIPKVRDLRIIADL